MTVKKRYIVLIIILVSFIPISAIFPQVFLIFHLDKYETSQTCDMIQGKWDWFYNTCKPKYGIHPITEQQCLDINAILVCSPCAPETAYSPFPNMRPWGCLDMCKGTCQLDP